MSMWFEDGISASRVLCDKYKKFWQDDALKRAGISKGDLDTYVDFTLPNQQIMQKIYGYYTEVFDKDPDRFKWAGMAKLAGAAVYKGLESVVVGRVASPGVGADRTSKALERELMDMNKEIFLDLAWQHEAYLQCGLQALKDRCISSRRSPRRAGSCSARRRSKEKPTSSRRSR